MHHLTFTVISTICLEKGKKINYSLIYTEQCLCHCSNEITNKFHAFKFTKDTNYCSCMIFIAARAACSLLGLPDVKIGNHSSLLGHIKSGEGVCLPDNITVPTSNVCNNESSCRNMTYWECKQGMQLIHILTCGNLVPFMFRMR